MDRENKKTLTELAVSYFGEARDVTKFHKKIRAAHMAEVLISTVKELTTEMIESSTSKVTAEVITKTYPATRWTPADWETVDVDYTVGEIVDSIGSEFIDDFIDDIVENVLDDLDEDRVFTWRDNEDEDELDFEYIKKTVSKQDYVSLFEGRYKDQFDEWAQHDYDAA